MNTFPELGGSAVRRSTDTHCLSYWHVPGGEYHLAEVREVFFPSEEAAEAAQSRMNYPPECPMVIPVNVNS
jgi:hypothetical protein